MPISPPVGSPYSPISRILQMARVRANDAGLSIDGELLANDQPYVEGMVNSAWRWLQGKAATAGIETYIKEAAILGIPAAINYGNQCFINWQGCGTSTLVDGDPDSAEYDAPALPPDLIMPLDVWFWSTGREKFLLHQADNGLSRMANCWEYDWRQDGMWFYGFNGMPVNMEVRYTAAFMDLSIAQDSPVPMLYSDDTLAWRIVGEYANARGGGQAATAFQMAEDAFSTFSQRTSRKNQRKTLRRQPYGTC